MGDVILSTSVRQSYGCKTFIYFFAFGCHPHERNNSKGEVSWCRDNSHLTDTKAGIIKSRKVK